MVLVSALAACVLLLSAPAAATVDSLRTVAARSRAVKDSLFAHAADSPLPPAQRPAFGGLVYYPYDEAFRVPVELHAYARPRLVPVRATDGTTMAMERYGLVCGQVAGKSFRLVVYREPAGATLEIFFTDATNAAETYAAGRFVQLQRQPAGYVLDFNTSYNPYCAYNHDYVCPLPPPGNHVPTAVRAGEKAYGADVAER